MSISLNNLWLKGFNVSIKIKLLIILGIIVFLVFTGACIVSIVIDKMTFTGGLWWTWKHLIDPGFIGEDGNSWQEMLIGSITVFMGVLIYAGFFITIFHEIVDNMVENLKKGHIPKKLSGHTVIAGTGFQLKHYIDALSSPIKKDEKLLIVIPDQQFFERTKRNCPKQTLIAINHIWTNHAIDRLNLKNANRIILLDDFGGDISNMLKVIVKLNLIRSQDNPEKELKIYIEVNNRILLPMLQISIRQFLKHASNIDVYYMSTTNTLARLALLDYPLEKTTLSIKQSNRVTLIIMAWSLFAEALLQQVLRVGHFYCPTRIVIATHDTEAMQKIISFEYPGLFDSSYVEKILTIECIDYNALYSVKTKLGDSVTIAVCSNNNDEVFIQAMQIYKTGFIGLKQIFVELPENSGYRDVIDAMDFSAQKTPIVTIDTHAKAFEMMDKLDKFAKQGHEQYLKEREAQGKRIKNEDGKYDNPADYSWDMLDEIHRGWNRSPVDHAEINLRILADKYQLPWHKKTTEGRIFVTKELRFKVQDIINHYEHKATAHHDDMELLAMLEHNRWSGEKIAEGWVLGKQTDKLRKISSFLVSYEKLTEEIKHYDREQVVAQLINLLGDAA